MNKETLYVIGAIVSIILLVLYFKDNSGNQTVVNPSFEVATSNPEIASIGAQVQIAKIGANSEMFKNFLDFESSNKQGDDAITINKQNVDATISVSNSNNSLAEKLGLGALDVQKNADNLNGNFLAQQDATLRKLGDQSLANQNKANSRDFWGGIFGGLSNSVLKIFGF